MLKVQILFFSRRERRIAERKYEELLEKLGPPLRASKKTDIPRMTDTPLPDLASTSDSGDSSEEEKET